MSAGPPQAEECSGAPALDLQRAPNLVAALLNGVLVRVDDINAEGHHRRWALFARWRGWPAVCPPARRTFARLRMLERV